MKNKQFYEKEILKIACEFKKVAIVNGEPANCDDRLLCEGCEFYGSERSCKDLLQEWLEQECEEIRIQPEVKKLKQDDRVLVSTNGENWVKRHFKISTLHSFNEGRYQLVIIRIDKPTDFRVVITRLQVDAPTHIRLQSICRGAMCF